MHFVLWAGSYVKAQNLQFAFDKVNEPHYISCSYSINLIVNPDFNLGNTGFSSTLPYGANCYPGYYYVGTTMQSKCSIWPASFVDHTSGTGYFQIIDGDDTNAPQEVWSETVNVNSNVVYTFSFWAKNLYSQQPFNLGFVINGLQIATTSSITPGVWTQYSTFWTAPMSGSISIAIRQITAGAYRDFGIDDVYFGFCDNGLTEVSSFQSSHYNLDMFPNPSSGIFSLKGEFNEAKVCIYDVLGNCVSSKDYKNDLDIKIDLSSQSKGIYFMEIISGDKRSVKKMVLE